MSFQDALERSGQYRTRIIAILEREGLPRELSYLPMVESGYRTKAVSSAGAVGLWQLVHATARGYGLRIDTYVDERRDPVRSTRAAARYLRDLHTQFGSWHFALAAYNLGPTRVARLVARRGNQAPEERSGQGPLPLASRNYVSRFVAAVQIAGAPERHGFAPPARTPKRYEVVRVPGSVGLRTVAALAGAPAAEIAELNPALVQRMTPPDRRGYPVRVPQGGKQRFELAYARMLGATGIDDAPPPAPSLVTAAETLRIGARPAQTFRGRATEERRFRSRRELVLGD